MEILYSDQLIRGPDGEWVRAKMDGQGRATIYLNVIAIDYPDLRIGIREYIGCLQKWDEDQPRDEDGKWTSGGGSDGGGDSGGNTSGGPEKVGSEIGPGYSPQAVLKPDGKIHTPNVDDAVRALFEGRPVDLKQPREVATLIDKLGKVTKDMIARGESAPRFNLCNVSVSGANLFCADNVGIPRIKMPQLDKDQTKAFVEHLKSEGHSIKKSKERSDYLRATQNEIDGAKVAKAAERLRDDPESKKGNPRIIVSRDNYILDGHHRWAAQVGVDALDNKLGDSKTKISRVDIGIIDLLKAAEKFTGGKGHQKEFDPNQPRDEDGKWSGDGGGDGGGGGGAEPAAEKPSSTGSGGKGKGKAQLADFAKDQVTVDAITRINKDKEKKFLDTWNTKIGEAPAEFKKEFIGGLKGTMGINYDDQHNSIQITGSLQESHEKNIGDYTREINFDKNTAVSSFFKLTSNDTGKGVGKQMLAANVQMYQKMGIDKVEVHANIDVGGYAWAKYGYVPADRFSWRRLAGDIDDNIARLSVGGFGMAGSWDAMGSSQQAGAERQFMDQAYEQSLAFEVDTWRDSGGALDQAKEELIDDATHPAGWVAHAISGYRKGRSDDGKPDIPFSDAQLVAATNVKYVSDGEGTGLFEVDFDDKKLATPAGVDPGQGTLPGIPELKPHELLTPTLRLGIITAIETAFDAEAEHNAPDVEPPDHLADSARESLSDMWDSMDDEEKYAWTAKHEPDLVQGNPMPREDAMPQEDVDRLTKLTNSDDPKAIWTIADSKYGKDLLLDTDWTGVLDLKDKEQMDRFNAYVGKAKSKAA